MAMVSRGYTGDIRTLRRPRLRWVDGAWIIVCIAVALLVLRADRAFA
jgi:energy-coupling factor transporter transmembrane protein EcfT